MNSDDRGPDVDGFSSGDCGCCCGGKRGAGAFCADVDSGGVFDGGAPAGGRTVVDDDNADDIPAVVNDDDGAVDARAFDDAKTGPVDGGGTACFDGEGDGSVASEGGCRRRPWYTL